MSFVDTANLKKVDIVDGVIIYQKRKKGQPLNIKLEQCTQEIIDKYDKAESPYIFPAIGNVTNIQISIRVSLYKVNSWLKRLSKELNIGVTLTMNVARNSWALSARNKIFLYI